MSNTCKDLLGFPLNFSTAGEIKREAPGSEARHVWLGLSETENNYAEVGKRTAKFLYHPGRVLYV